MATSNIQVEQAWVKIAEADQYTVLVSWRADYPVEFATTAADAAPSEDLRGHLLSDDQAMTRHAIGGGYLWARCDNARATVVLAVSAS